MYLTIKQFQGTVPAKSETLLASQYAQAALNTKITPNVIHPIFEDADLFAAYDINAEEELKTLYRYRCNKYEDTSDLWLRWHENVDIVKDQIYNDEQNRIIVTGLDEPRITNATLLHTYLATDPLAITVDSSNSYKLGIPVPAQPKMEVTGTGTTLPEIRAYTILYTRHWSDKIDLGPNSLPAHTTAGDLTITVHSGQSAVISEIVDAPAGHGISHIAVYRSLSGTTDTKYQFVTEFEIAAAKAGSVSGVTWNAGTSMFSFTDGVATKDLGDVLTSESYTSPPATLSGIVTLNNGVLVGFSDNNIYMSEPYQAHAWPEKYRIAIDSKIIGLGTYGNTLVVCTDAEPLSATITDPTLVVLYPFKQAAPCTSKRGIVQWLDAVYYPSNYGLVKISSAGVINITQPLLDAETFRSFAPETMIGAIHDEKYFGFYRKSTGFRGLIIDLNTTSSGIVELDIAPTAIFLDKTESRLFFARKNEQAVTLVGEYGAGTVPRKIIWKSKKFVVGDMATNFSAARVRFKPYIYDVARTLTVDDMKSSIASHPLNVTPVNGFALGEQILYASVVFKLFVDGVLRYEKLVTNSAPFRLPTGYVGSEIEVEVAGYSKIYGIDAATSMKELAVNQ